MSTAMFLAELEYQFALRWPEIECVAVGLETYRAVLDHYNITMVVPLPFPLVVVEGIPGGEYVFVYRDPQKRLVELYNETVSEVDSIREAIRRMKG